MTRVALYDLVMEALYDRRRPRSSKTCLVVNDAGQELRQCGADALSVIDEVLRTVVLPRTGSITMIDCGFPGLPKVRSINSEFPGLWDVIGAYLVISERNRLNASVEFIEGLPRELLGDALASVQAFFRKMENGYNSGVAPSEELRKFVREQASSAEEEVRTIAKAALEVM